MNQKTRNIFRIYRVSFDNDKYYRNIVPSRIKNYLANINFITQQEKFGTFTFSIACTWKLNVRLNNTLWQDCDYSTLVTFGRTCVNSMLDLMITQMPPEFIVLNISVYVDGVTQLIITIDGENKYYPCEYFIVPLIKMIRLFADVGIFL